jgi:hypothetical protein
VFLLGDVQQPGVPMYFMNINTCNYFASRITKQYGNYYYKDYIPKEHKVTAYCKPVYIPKETETLYE